MLPSFFAGFGFVFKGIHFIFNTKGMKRWALAPFLIDFILFVVTLYWGLGQVSVWSHKAAGYFFSSTESFWYSVLFYPLLILLGFGFLVLLIYLMVLLSTIIAAPFNALLAERTLMALGVLPDRPFNMARWLKSSAYMIWVSLLRSVLLIFLGVLIFVLSFFPGVNIVASYLALLVLAFDHTDYAMESMEWSLRRRFNELRVSFADFSGMAAFLGLSLLVPGLTLLTLPAAVVGSTVVLQERLKIEGRKNDSRANS